LEASRLFINAAATPPFQGGECVRTETVSQFIHTVIDRRCISSRRWPISLRHAWPLFTESPG
jgi:hypothetical protein